jgi:spore germination protein YaaH
MSTAPVSSEPPAESPAPSVEPSAQASVEAATATPTTPAATPPAGTATPLPSSDRYALLEPCRDEPDCWIYTVRQGDNLVSIARYFGVPLEVVTERNPWTETTGLVAGQELRLPPPTR